MENLFEMMRKYGEYFNLYSEDFDNCDVEEVIEAIKEAGGIKVRSIEEVWEDLNERKLSWQRMSPENEDDKWREELYQDVINHILDTQFIIEDAQRRGLKGVVEIEFGDNHGNIEGGKIGNLMDYEGRNIHIGKSDFIVTTEQRR